MISAVRGRHTASSCSATNRVDMFDPALLHAGRFDHIIEIGRPTKPRGLPCCVYTAADGRSKMSISIEIARRTRELSGADLEKAMRDAAMPAVRDQITERYIVISLHRS
jgi:ATP-dependent 26S proteasome regulatory subunit